MFTSSASSTALVPSCGSIAPSVTSRAVLIAIASMSVMPATAAATRKMPTPPCSIVALVTMRISTNAPANASAERSCDGLLDFERVVGTPWPFRRSATNPPSIVSAAIAPSHQAERWKRTGDTTATSIMILAGSTPHARSAVAAAPIALRSSRARRAAPTVAAVLDTSPPRRPLATVPARSPSSACAMYPTRLSDTTSTTSIHAVRGLIAPKGPMSRSGSTGRITSAISTKVAIARTSSLPSRRTIEWSGSRR